MTYENVLHLSVENAAWQDYRASNTGMVVFYSSDPVSEIPIREIPEDIPSDILPEPNYETGTYGFFGCTKSKVRNSFVKSKIRYLLFMTKYEGTSADYKGRYFLTGYYRIVKTADLKRQHIRYLSDYSCLDEDVCYALRAEEMRFVRIEDALEITEKVVKKWGGKGKITRQTRFLLNEEQTTEVLEYLQSKVDATAEYIAETFRLQPHSSAEEDEESQE
jgi:hypothetical protein